MTSSKKELKARTKKAKKLAKAMMDVYSEDEIILAGDYLLNKLTLIELGGSHEVQARTIGSTKRVGTTSRVGKRKE